MKPRLRKRDPRYRGSVTFPTARAAFVRCAVEQGESLPHVFGGEEIGVPRGPCDVSRLRYLGLYTALNVTVPSQDPEMGYPVCCIFQGYMCHDRSTYLSHNPSSTDSFVFTLISQWSLYFCPGMVPPPPWGFFFVCFSVPPRTGS